MDQKSDVIAVIGPKAVGKTSVVNSLTGEKVTKRYSESRDLEKKNIIMDGRLLEIWDAPSSYTIDQVSSLNPNIILVVLELSVLAFSKIKADMLKNYVPKEKLNNDMQIYFILNKRDCEQDFPFSAKKITKDFCEEIKKEKGYNVTVIPYSARYQRSETAKKKNPIWEEVLRKDTTPAFLFDEEEQRERSLPVKKQKSAFWKQAKGAVWKSSPVISSIDNQDEQKERLLPPSPG